MKDLIYTTNFKNCETEVVKKFERLRSIAIKTNRKTHLELGGIHNCH